MSDKTNFLSSLERVRPAEFKKLSRVDDEIYRMNTILCASDHGTPGPEQVYWLVGKLSSEMDRADAWKAIAGRLAADLRDELQGRERDSLTAFDALSKSEG